MTGTAVRYADDDRRAELTDELRALLGERLSTSPSVRKQHGHGESYHAGAAPDAVAFVESTDEVSAVLAACDRARVPVVPFGAGTSLEGGVCAVHGGVSLDLSGMSHVLRVNIDDLDAVVEAGVTRRQLNAVTRPEGAFFSVDPGADASLGGMAATRASGTTTVGYGTMRENVLGLTAVMADGTVVHAGGHARKSAAGYDLVRLLIGSEGTLGVITELVVRLQPTPEAIHAARCTFPDLQSAVTAVVGILRSGAHPARIELLDHVMVAAVAEYSDLALPVGPAVFFEFHGGPQGVAEQIEIARWAVEESGGTDFCVAASEGERRQLWRARHDALPAAKALRPGGSVWTTDVCVPISRLAECVLATQADIVASELLAPIAGHVGDGNFHLAFVIDPSDHEEMARARALNDRMVELALVMGGTCTGEHGVGLGKIDDLAAEAPTGVGLMAAIKGALDPNWILNPGKLFPVDVERGSGARTDEGRGVDAGLRERWQP